MEKEDNKNSAKKRKKIKLIIVLIATVVLGIYIYINYRAERIEILEIGENYIEVFNQNTKYLEIISLINFLIVFFTIYITNIIIKIGLKKFFKEENKETPKLANKSISFIIALLVSIITSGWYMETTMKAINTTQFGVSDPIFNMDIAYYMFQKPLIEIMLIYIVVLIVFLTI